VSAVLDLHVHSEASDDSRASVEAYLQWLSLRGSERPVDGIVLTEHRQFNAQADYRALEDRYGLLVLKGAELETEYGHLLVYGITPELARRFNLADIRLPAQGLIDEVRRLGGAVVAAHPGRVRVGLYDHYADKPALRGLVALEGLNGGSRGDENARSAELVRRLSLPATGGSDSHLVSTVGLCATRFAGRITNIAELVAALWSGDFEPADFRKPKPAAAAKSNAAAG
jgi:predicted metal-dependent phosphoesterase TrpH